MSAWRPTPGRRLPPSPEEVRAAGLAAWEALTRTAAIAAADPASEAKRLAMGKTVAKAFRAKSPTPYARDTVWFELMDLARQYVVETANGRTLLAERLGAAAKACAPFFDHPPPPRPRADIDG